MPKQIILAPKQMRKDDKFKSAEKPLSAKPHPAPLFSLLEELLKGTKTKNPYFSDLEAKLILLSLLHQLIFAYQLLEYVLNHSDVIWAIHIKHDEVILVVLHQVSGDQQCTGFVGEVKRLSIFSSNS